jgi:hypothetical protein
VPRRTHPCRRGGHTRAHVRAQRDRWQLKRWRQIKDRYATGALDFPRSMRPETVELAARFFGHDGPMWAVHPDDVRRLPDALRRLMWPMDRSRNELTRNPLNNCACGVCRWMDHEPLRTRAKRGWRLEWAEELTESNW